MSLRSTRWFLGMAVWGAMVGAISAAVSLTLALGANSASAQQVVPDATLPQNSAVARNGNNFTITDGTRRGGNLFHSFKEFSVPTGGTAFFNNATDIQNIFSRVTGGSVSNIDGLIKANGTANLFLINPSGIVFGKNASLNVGGSFVGTTANAIQFGNLGSFSATNPEAPSPLLTINPSALLFNQIAAGASIQNSSTAAAQTDPAGFNALGLRVGDGKSLLLVGGNINMDGGQLNAYGGRVELSGLASPGFVGLNVDGDKLSLDFPASSTRADISLTNSAGVFVEAAGGGDIAVNARNLEVSGRSRLSAGIGEGLGNAGAKAGDITVNATGDIKLDGSGIINNVQRQGIGNGGNITLSTNSLSLTNGAQLIAITYGQGNAGNVIINATNSVSLDGSKSAIFSSVGDIFATTEQRNAIKGNSGNIQITTSQLSLTNGVQLLASTFGQGNAGNVIINATKSVSLDGSYTNSNGQFFSSAISSSVGNVSDSPEQRNAIKGNGGNIQITSPQLSLTNGAQLIASTLGQGDAGNVIINATNSVSLDGSKSAIFSSVGDFSDSPEQRNAIKGNGGNIQITTSQLSLTNGAELIASTSGQGDAGNVIINATNSVSFDGSDTNSNGQFFPSGIFSSVGDSSKSPEQRNAIKGNGGNIQITTSQLSLTNGAGLVASTSGQGNAGNVIINATNSVSFDGSRSAIFNSVGYVSDSPEQRNAIKGNGGNIQITTSQLSLTNSVQLLASTYGQGNAGNVIINATKSVFLDGSNTTIFSSVGYVSDSPEQRNAIKGNGGNIQITSPQLSLTNDAGLIASTFGQGNAGNVTVNALDALSLANAAIFSTVDTGGVGKGGNIDINAATLSLKDGAQLATITRGASYTGPAGRGDAGNVNVKVSGAVDITGEKNGFSSGIFSSVQTGTAGNGGNITIDSDSFSLRDGAILTASTFGQGNAGTIKVNAVANVTISGKSSNFNSGLYVNSQSPTGTAGDIIVTSPRVTLDNTGRLNAQSASGNGGNINLQSGLLLLRHGAQISTSAGIDQKGGNGGNITINTPNGFIVSIPNENSDITANAFSGSGGIVKISALGVYNFNRRSLEDLEKLLGTNDPSKLNPQLLPTNDITAISATSPALSGIVQVNTPDIDPSRGLVQLPTIITENTPKLAAPSCAAFDTGGSSFTVTGRGGLPPSPDEPLTNDVIWTDARIPTTTSQQHSSNKPSAKPHSKPKAEPIVIAPAIGWVFNKDKSEVTLISSHNANSLGTTPATCPAQR